MRTGRTYAAPLAAATLTGKRLGVVVPAERQPTPDSCLPARWRRLRAAGAEIVPVPEFAPSAEKTAERESWCSKFELKHDHQCLSCQPAGRAAPAALAELIAFNRATPRELVLFGQERFEMAAQARGDLSDPLYQAAHGAAAKRDCGPCWIKAWRTYHLDALIQPTTEPGLPHRSGAGRHPVRRQRGRRSRHGRLPAPDLADGRRWKACP